MSQLTSERNSARPQAPGQGSEARGPGAVVPGLGGADRLGGEVVRPRISTILPGGRSGRAS